MGGMILSFTLFILSSTLTAMWKSLASLPNSSVPSGVGLRMWLLWIVLLSLLSVASGGADSKAVTTTLTTKWADTPLLLEARYDTALLKGSSTLAALHINYISKGDDR